MATRSSSDSSVVLVEAGLLAGASAFAEAFMRDFIEGRETGGDCSTTACAGLDAPVCLRGLLAAFGLMKHSQGKAAQIMQASTLEDRGISLGWSEEQAALDRTP